MTEREAMQKAFEIIGVLKPDNFVHRELQGEAWDALRQALAQPEPQVCCGDYEKCIKSCTPRGRWLAEKEFTKEKPLPLVDIGVDVTPKGTHVVAFYNKHNAVQEMFYSKFHPLAKFEQSKYSDIVSDGGLDPRNKFDAQPEQEPVAVWELTEDGWDTIADAAWMETLPVGTKLYTAPPRKEWVGLTNEDWENTPNTGKQGCERDAELFDWVEQTLKDKNESSR